ncbi:MAG TPA: hypothetical protein VN611_10455, partial [Patescibacteria group bacterium]|nr:hypothetical protein [Patescibacteria group bacterium]
MRGSSNVGGEPVGGEDQGAGESSFNCKNKEETHGKRFETFRRREILATTAAAIGTTFIIF